MAFSGGQLLVGFEVAFWPSAEIVQIQRPSSDFTIYNCQFNFFN
ncbi:hypothetical protein RISK_005654 [Rhodopirellula islandica]|uniref:Uncharacterized protein n=1 Tax=Rhodopirellula islandica TaxID=595434 RepID=A0A0J1B7P2_RHOIS|nr:hypothetical protein RISK_005654 [Rhodopirellula islandica]